MTRAGERNAPAGRATVPDRAGRVEHGTGAGRRPAAADRRADEVRAVTVTVTVLKVVATMCVLVPALDRTVTGVLAIAVALTAGGTVLRWALRRVRWWVEDRLDDRVAAAWRAARAPANGSNR